MQHGSLWDLADALSPGEAVFISGSSGEPTEFTQLLVDEPSLAPGVWFIATFVPGINSRNLANATTARRMHVFFMQPGFENDRRLGCVYFDRKSYYEIHQFLSLKETQVDTIVIQVSEPNSQGICSLGPSCEFLPTLLPKAHRLFGIINPNVPFIGNAPFIHLEDFERIARSEAQLPMYQAGRPNKVVEEIVRHLAKLIPNEATLETGLGKIPAHLLPALNRHKNIALHSGMLSDALMHISNTTTLSPDTPIFTAVLVGSESLYRQLPDISKLQLNGIGFTHDPHILRSLPRFCAVNSAFEVDLFGNVNAEVLDGSQLSGPGGLPDFASAASQKNDGLSIIALPSTDPSGKRSRILSRLDDQSLITVSGEQVDVVVTEYGIATIEGMSCEGRMQNLIQIAHPNHRESLRQQFKACS